MLVEYNYFRLVIFLFCCCDGAERDSLGLLVEQMICHRSRTLFSNLDRAHACVYSNRMNL